MRFPKLQKSEDTDDPKWNAHLSERNQAQTTRRAGSKQGPPRNQRPSEGGFTTLGGIILSLVFILGSGTILLLHQITNRIEKQIELDQLTGSVAIQLRASILTMENSEKRLRIAKATMIAGCTYLPSCPAFTRAYQLQKKVEAGIQEIAEMNWNTQKSRWYFFRPVFSTKNKLPSLREIMTEGSFIFNIQYSHLISASRVWKSSDGWKIAWVE